VRPLVVSRRYTRHDPRRKSVPYPRSSARDYRKSEHLPIEPPEKGNVVGVIIDKGREVKESPRWYDP